MVAPLPVLPEILVKIAERVSTAGGRSFLVGGSVRDHLLGTESKDFDVEVFGLTAAKLEELLSEYGPVLAVGRAFGVFRIKGYDVDFSLPRRDSKIRAGHRGFDIDTDPDMSFEQAARRRDLTINSMGLDLISGELQDPHGGLSDLRERRLRATDPRHFPEDPLRGLRAAQFTATFEMTPDAQLISLCRALNLSELSPERMFDQLCKLLLRSNRPSLGFEFLATSNLIRFFPELAAMLGVEQEAEWHPEGDVFVHTLMVVDEAANSRRGEDEDLALMWGALCHDIGKPTTTQRIDGRVRSFQHDVAGVPLAENLLTRLRAPTLLVDQVKAIVRYHLAPALFANSQASDKAYRRLARNLRRAGVTMELLLRVAAADHFGRTTPDALAREYPAGALFRDKAAALNIALDAPSDVVMGRHLIARGLAPGPKFGFLLTKCREIQDETGWTDPERILDAVFSEATTSPGSSERE